MSLALRLGFSSCLLLALLACLLPQSAAAVPMAALPGGSPPSTDQIGDHLTRLEQLLSQQLAPLAARAASDDGLTVQLNRQASDLQRHLRSLRPLLVASPDVVTFLGRRLEALEQQVQHLGMAEEQPESESGDLRPDKAQQQARVEATNPVSALNPTTPGQAIITLNDDCGTAPPIGHGQFMVELGNATQDGISACGPNFSLPIRDVWFRYTAPADGAVSAFVSADPFSDIVLSVHSGCPGSEFNELTCSAGSLVFDADAGQQLWLRVATAFLPSEPVTLTLADAGSISGTVTDATTGDPLETRVQLWKDDSFPFAETTTLASGHYSFPIAAPGTYFVATRSEGYRDEYYDDIVPADEASRPTDGTPIEVGTGANVTAIDFALQRLGAVSGTVRDEVTGLPIQFAQVTVFAEDGGGSSFASTDEVGRYTRWLGDRWVRSAAHRRTTKVSTLSRA